MKKTLTPRNTIISEGKVAYSEGFQAWNTIRLKKELFNEFPELKEKRSQFFYELIYSRTFEDLEKVLKEMKKIGSLPVLMFLSKEL